MADVDDLDEGIAEGRAIVAALRAVSEFVDRIAREQEEALGEVFGTVLLDQVADWFADTVRGASAPEHGSREAAKVAGELSRQYRQGNEVVQGVIEVGFLERLPTAGDRGAQIASALPDPLRDALRNITS